MKWAIAFMSLSLSASALEVALTPQEVSRGETFAVSFKVDDQTTCSKRTVAFQDKTTNFLPFKADQCIALVGVPFKSDAGVRTVSVNERGWLWQKQNQITLNVTEGDYPSEVLNVDNNFVNLPEQTQVRVEEEWLKIQAFYENWQPYDNILKPLALPVDSPITSNFGTQRMFNGELKSYHSGVDLRAGLGAKIKAAQGGQVILSEPLYYTGNHVVIDHGAGVITTYSHLNESLVQAGQMVEQGQTIGYSGATGRVTGPHLHWGAKVHTTTVNPMQLKALLEQLLSNEGVNYG